MPKQAILPLVHVFLVCREIRKDPRSGEYNLIGPTFGFALPHFPGLISFAVYAHFSEVRSGCYLELRLVDADGDILWNMLTDDPIPPPHDDPLWQQRFISFNSGVPIPGPGRYDLLLLAHGTEIARYPLRMERIDSAGG